MEDFMPKYTPFPKVSLPDRKWPEAAITHTPIWCSVDLRDGNQALAEPMSVEEKLKMFQLLLDIGIKQIEVGFPSASQIEYDFTRLLIERNLIPDDVYIQVLTQAREHLIRKTFESLKGAKKAIVHLYNSTSPLQRKVTFKMSKDEIKGIAVNGTKIVKSLVPTLPDCDVRFEYSPESFSGTEVDYALEVCEAVMDAWEPTEEKKIILNLPDTVQTATPNIYADQVEWFCSHMKNRKLAVISLHTHNDRSCGVASTELGMLAGAERVEGTLFGNGERTGNVDLITVALNMYAQGVDHGLNLRNLPEIIETYKRNTGMDIHPRHPYAGELVFTAFSGSHQDAIKKGLDLREKKENPEDAEWEVPYLPIDPKDIGRTYEAIIRINSQSGKGGVAYVMGHEFGYELPKNMHPEIGALVNKEADRLGRELQAEEVLALFKKEFLNRDAPLKLLDFTILSSKIKEHKLSCTAKVEYNGKPYTLEGLGNGPISAFVHALDKMGWFTFKLLDFHEDAIGSGSETEAIGYINVELNGKQRAWGCGLDTDINVSGLRALISAINRASIQA
ncbi:MAG: 2-isopropylmalate synthase [Spirochaetales bacterium]|nr:2-isopropylmalate synthase [Spirochaetales bacterium]